MAEKKNTELSIPQRFTNAVVAAYGDVAKGVTVTEKQLALIGNYYIKLDEMFKDPRNNISWNQVKMNELALTVAHAAKLNLDMQLGHISFMPFWDSKVKKYSLVAVKSAKGYEYIAKRFGLDPPEHLIVELVYETDKFTEVKKDAMHDFDTYTFSIVNPFNRGKIIGGFAYLEYPDKTRNKILVMSEEEILSHRPPKYSENFWGGANKKKMYIKTIAKEILKPVTLDPDKVNGYEDSFKKLEAEEINLSANVAHEEIEENMGTGDFVDVDFEPVDNSVESVENVSETDEPSLFDEDIL